MWHNNKKSPAAVNKPKAPAKPADLNATAKSSNTSLKFNSPEIRVSLADGGKTSVPKNKKLLIKSPKPKK
jgi:hypothetical protein